MPRNRRRFLRFSLRSLLALVTLAAVLTWLYRQLVVIHREQREFLAAAEKLGARVTIQPWRSGDLVPWGSDSALGLMDSIVEVDFSGQGLGFDEGEPRQSIGEPSTDGPSDTDYEALTNPVTPFRLPSGVEAQIEKERRAVRIECLRRLAGLPGLKRLSLSLQAIEDSDLKHVANLKQLECLDLSGNNVSEVAIASLALPRLRWLYLANCKHLAHVEIVALPQLEHLDLSRTGVRTLCLDEVPNLRSLNLSHTPIQDGTLDDVARLAKLERLGLGYTRLNAIGLAHLRRLSQLRELCIDGASIDDDGVEHLKALPSLKVLHLYWVGYPDDGIQDQEIRQALSPRMTVNSTVPSVPPFTPFSRF